MIQWSDVPIYLHRTPVDFRKSINGLSFIVQESMALDVFSGALFVFGSRRRDKIKILYWDKTGFCLWYKRLEKDKFKWPRAGDAVLNINSEQFDWLLRGLDIEKLTPHTAKYFLDIG
jgi:transposase